MTQEATKINKLVAVYARVSTSTQENEGTIETQLSAVRDFAQKNGYTIVREYLDNGWSGDVLSRPALDDLRMDAKSKNWEAVLTYDPDRLARRGAWQEVIMEGLQELGIETLFVTIPQAKTDEDKIMQKMRGVFTEYERMKIKERFRLGKVRKAKEGYIIATEAPYGYTFITKTSERQGYYEVNEEEARVVKSIFSWVADEELTIRAVIRRLQELKIKPRKSKRGVWSTSTISSLLRNRTYIGEAHYGASYAVVPENPIKKDGYKKIKKSSRRAKPEEEWIKIPSPQILDEDLFERANRRLKANFQMSQRNTRNEYLLAHRIWCPCGQRRAGEGPQKGKYLYYRCTDRVKSFPLKASCTQKGLDARLVDTLVWKKLSGLMSSPELLLKQAERWLNNRNAPTQSALVDLQSAEKEIVKLKAQEERYVKAYGAEAISIEQLKEYTTPIKEKIGLLNEQIEKGKIESRQLVNMKTPTKEEIQTFCDQVVRSMKNLKFEAKQAIVRNVIEKVVDTNNELLISGYIPLNINVLPSYRYRRSSERGQVHAI